MNKWILIYRIKREWYRIRKNSVKISKYNRKIEAENRQRIIDRRETETHVVGIMATPHTYFVASAVAEALNRLNIKSHIYISTPPIIYNLNLYIVICAQMFKTLPPGEKRIIFQLEQSISSRWFTKKYLDDLEQSLAVLDYSIANLEFLEKNGIRYPHTFHLPIGGISHYKDPSTDADASASKNDTGDFSVLFYGDANNDRRRELLAAIQSRFPTKILNDTFGPALYEQIRKAKVVVNLHYYENALLESTRIYECLSLGARVVSESSSDIHEHEILKNVVSFVEVGNIDKILDAIDVALNSPAPDLHEVIRASQEKFFFMFFRMLLALNVIDYTLFYESTKNYEPGSKSVCLSLPETISRRRAFTQTKNVSDGFFDGLRFTPSWVGCALSYKYICQKALQNKIKRICICEDDVSLPTDIEEKISLVSNFLDYRQGSWDIFSGLIAHLHAQSKIISVEEFQGLTFVTLDRMTSMVFNIYSESAIELIANWDANDSNVETNTIDRYLESRSNLRTVTTLPFLVGHREDLNSSIWGSGNSVYRNIILDSEVLLKKKVDDFLAQQAVI